MDWKKIMGEHYWKDTRKVRSWNYPRALVVVCVTAHWAICGSQPWPLPPPGELGNDADVRGSWESDLFPLRRGLGMGRACRGGSRGPDV